METLEEIVERKARERGEALFSPVDASAPKEAPEDHLTPAVAPINKCAERRADLEKKMAPRLCRLASCRKEFVPKRVQNWGQDFCCHDHQATFWVLAHQQGAAIVAGGEIVAIHPAEENYESHNQAVLSLLAEYAGQWVDHPYARLRVMWHSRVANLRKRGHVIECRCVGEKSQGDKGRFLQGSKVDYQYRLVRIEGK